jgi:probable F420-dependent oxidoreductase
MKVGAVILLAEDAGRRAPRYAEIRERALQAEQAGFDSIWLYDHLIYRLPRMGQRGIWECWTMLAALAEATTRVEIGTLVVCTAFRNPAILAKMATTLDEVSGGRFILGLGAGWNKAEFEAFGLPFDHRGDRFEEALRIVVPLVREGSVDFHGAYHQAARCEIRPRGPRTAGPPLLIGAKGPRMLRLTAQHADSWNTAYLSYADDLIEPRAALWAACAEVGRDPATLGVTATVSVAYPDLGRPQGFMDKYVTGSAKEVAAALRGYEEIGAAQVMCHVAPNTAAALDRLAEALAIYRAGAQANIS